MAGRTESIRSLCRRTAVCGLCAGLSVVLMAVGSAFGVLTYVCPMLAGIPVYLVRRAWGTRPALCLWAAAGLLGLMLVPDREMAALGYQWDTQAVPPCGEPSDSQEGTEEVPGTSSASSDGAE